MPCSCRIRWMRKIPMVTACKCSRHRVTQDGCVTAELALWEVKIECNNNLTLYQLDLGLIILNEALSLTWSIHFCLGSGASVLCKHQDRDRSKLVIMIIPVWTERGIRPMKQIKWNRKVNISAVSAFINPSSLHFFVQLHLLDYFCVLLLFQQLKRSK